MRKVLNLLIDYSYVILGSIGVGLIGAFQVFMIVRAM